MDTVDVRLTDDGSHTVYSTEFDAFYHSTKGAVTESNIVFIEAGLQFIANQKKSKISIFEMGFGTGLNVHLSYLFSLNNKIESRELLKNIQFTLSGKKIYTILGKNGSGKSTLIKSLTCLLNEELYIVNGNVLWFDENIFEMKYDRLIKLRRNEIKYVLQDLTNNFDPLKKLKLSLIHI